MTTFWFDHVLSGDPFVPPPGDDFDVAPDVAVDRLVAQFALAGERCRARVINLPIDGAPAWWPANMFGPWRLDSVSCAAPSPDHPCQAQQDNPARVSPAGTWRAVSLRHGER